MSLNWSSNVYRSQSMIAGQLNPFCIFIQYFRLHRLKLLIIYKLLDASVKTAIPQSFATSPRDQLPVFRKISCTGAAGFGADVDIELSTVCGALGVLRTVAFPSFDVLWNMDTKLGTLTL